MSDTIRIDVALQALLGATTEQARVKATIDTLRGRLTAEAKRRTAADGAAPTWKAPQLGVVRWDVPQQPTLSVTKPEALASFLAERDPAAVVATITVSADQLEQALEALQFSQIEAQAEVTLVTPLAERWLTDNAEVIGAETTSGFEVHELVDTEGGRSRGASVPGVQAVLPPARLVVTLDKDKKAEAAAAGAEEALAALGEVDTPAPVIPAQRAPEQLHTDVRFSSEASKEALQNAARSAGLPTSGTKQQLVDRLNGAL